MPMLDAHGRYLLDSNTATHTYTGHTDAVWCLALLKQWLYTG